MGNLNLSIVILTVATILSITVLGLILSVKQNEEEYMFGCGTIAMDVILDHYDKPLDLAGRHVFEQCCNLCHQMDSKLVGPALRNVFERRDSLWIVDIILNEEKLRLSGDTIAIKLFDEYTGFQHPNYEMMPDSSMRQLLIYLREEGKRSHPTD